MANTKTKRGNGEGTVRKRKDGRWEARYRDPVSQKQKSVYGKTQKEVLQILQKRMKECNIGDSYNDEELGDLSLERWLNIWMSKYNANTKPLTVASYMGIIKNHIVPTIGSTLLVKIRLPDIQEFYELLQREKGLSPKTIKNIHGVLHKALEKARVIGYVQNNVADGVVLPKVLKPEINPIEEDMISKFIEEASKDKYANLLLVTLFTGMRQGEILGLTWDKIDFSKGIITVSSQLQKEKKKNGKYYLSTTKNNKSRKIAPAKFVMEILKNVYDASAQRQFYYQNSMDIPNLVFVNEDGKHICHHTLYKHCKKVTALIGMPEARFHDLRHTYAVLALQNGDDIKTVQENLGHHSAAFTLDTYAHMTNKMRYDSANRMDKFIAQL